MTKLEYRKFFKYLQKSYPLVQKLTITLELQDTERIEHKGRTLYGIVSFNDRTAMIRVACSDNPLVVLKVIAHEYRHLIQRFNMGWISDGPSDLMHEKDAQMFGSEEAWKWVRAEGLV